jgi:DsbC/DsbD-like thiol-disulfide interchange protein
LTVTASCLVIQQAESHKRSMSPQPSLYATIGVVCIVLTAFSPFSARAAEAETGWVPGPLSKARLVAAGGLDGEGVYRLALEIALKGDAQTYWRSPGDAGVPPKLSVEGSRNLKSADLSYPAPTRMEEAGLQVFGYRGALLLPLDVVPADRARPVHLAVTFSYAACEKICIPAEARAELDLTPDAPPSAQTERIAAARAGLPERTANGGAVTLDVTAAKGAEPASWRVRIAKPAGPWRDLFAEAPDGWFFETRPQADGFDLVAVEKPKAPQYPVDVTLTLARAERAFETKLALPAP